MARVPDQVPSSLVRSVVADTTEQVSADDRQWFVDNPEAAVRWRRYVHGELGFGYTASRWLREVEKIRRMSDKRFEATLMIEVTKDTTGATRQFAYIALTDPTNITEPDIGIVPPWAVGKNFNATSDKNQIREWWGRRG